MIEISGLHLNLGGKQILSDLSFQLKERTPVAVIGPNGAGKSSLLKCIMRLEPEYAGRITMYGDEIRSISMKKLARRISYVPQAGGRIVPFTVKEFIALGRYPYRSAFSALTRADHEAVDTALDITGLKNFSYQMMDTLSGGERQIAFIAAALAQKTPVMLLDEPATFLDYKHQQLVQRLLNTINRDSESTIIQVTHDVNWAAWSSRRVLALKSGRMIFDGSPEELFDPDRLYEIYDTRFIISRHPETDRPMAVPAEGDKA